MSLFKMKIHPQFIYFFWRKSRFSRRLCHRFVKIDLKIKSTRCNFFFIEIYFFLINDKTMQEVIFIKHSCRMNRKLELVAEKFFWMSVAGFYFPIRQSLESKPSRIVIFLSRCFLFSRDGYWELMSKHLISLETRSYWQGDEWLFIFFEEMRWFLLETPEDKIYVPMTVYTASCKGKHSIRSAIVLFMLPLLNCGTIFPVLLEISNI